MAVSLQSRINELKKKFSRVASQYGKICEEKSALEMENAALRAENERLKGELRVARTDAEYLTMSHRLASGPDDIVRVRRRIEQMVRDIDRCISQLKE